MHCPYCQSDATRVADSRLTEAGAAVRRRRACESCGQRFTTFERAEPLGLVVAKRSGLREPFTAEKILVGLRSAAKGRPVSEQQLAAMVIEVEAAMSERGPLASTEEIGREVLERLRALDEVAYLRFASVYKSFDDPADFEREAHRLAEERT